MPTLLGLLVLSACKTDPPDRTNTVTTPPEPDPLVLGVLPPVLPTQPVMDLFGDAELAHLQLLHEDPAGRVSTLDELQTATGERVGWAPPDDRWDVGTHTLRIDDDNALFVGPEDSTIDELTFEITDTWTGDGSEHDAWTIDTLVLLPAGLGELVLEQIGELIVVPPEDPGGDWILLTTMADCVVYQGPVVVLPDGYELALAPFEVDIGAEGPLVVEDTRLAFSFADDGSTGVGQFHAIADGRQTTDLDEDDGIGPQWICETAGALGVQCHRCDADDPEPLCMDLYAPWVGMSPRAEPLPFDPTTLPVCGVDVSGAEQPELNIEIEIPPISCNGPDVQIPEIECGCTSAPGRLGVVFGAVVPLWWRRRRRR